MASMEKEISTYVFIHFNTTCLPNDGRCRATELCMLAIHKDDIDRAITKHAEGQRSSQIPELPRVVNKLVLCLNPKVEIPEEAAGLSVLTNEEVKRQRRFSTQGPSLLEFFLGHLKKEICFIAHNGDEFDFRVLKTELDLAGESTLLDGKWCVDSLGIIKSPEVPNKRSLQSSEDSLKLPLKKIKTSPMDAKEDKRSSKKEVQMKRTKSLPAATVPPKSFALRKYYKEIFETTLEQPHTAEGFCEALVRVAIDTPDFFKCVNKRAKRLSKIQPINQDI